jgi:hypothetical protein
MASAKGSLGLTTTVIYESLSITSHYSKQLSPQYPKTLIQPPMFVVTSLTSDNAIGTTNTTQFSYGNAINSMDGRGFLGFSWQESQLFTGPSSSLTALQGRKRSSSRRIGL